MSVMSKPLIATVVTVLSLIALAAAIYATVLIYHLVFGTVGGNL